MPYIPRAIEPIIKRYLQAFPVISLTGPRQSGKSTVLRHLLADDYQYVTFDNYKMVELVEHDPDRFIAQFNHKVIFDEAQKVPKLFPLVKEMVDNNRQDYGRFVLTGSSQFTLMKNISESLAGRVGVLSLLPMQYQEMPENLIDLSIFKGGYPELVLRDYRDDDLWFGSYLSTYVERDVRMISNIEQMREFQKLIGLLAARIGQTLNMTALSSDLGVSLSTIKRWISVLEASYVIYLLPPYFNNYGKRITKSPKIYFYDTGLAAYLTGITSSVLFQNGPLYGPLFENYIVIESLKQELSKGVSPQFYFYKTHDDHEIDLIIDRKTYKELIEIKASYSYSKRMLATMEGIQSGADTMALVYQGEDLSFAPVCNFKTFLSRPHS